MRISMKADLEMQDVLPANASRIESETPLSVADALELTSLKEGEACMTSVNGTIVVKSKRQDYLLEDGDVVRIFAPLRGG